MSITLTYPIRETHENLALKKDQTVVAYYRIPNTPITITDDEKKGKHKITVAQMMKKLQKNKFFEISLIPKDYLLEEKMRDFSDALADDSRELGEELLLYTVDRLTDEMEIPYQFDWVVGVTYANKITELPLKTWPMRALMSSQKKSQRALAMNMN